MRGFLVLAGILLSLLAAAAAIGPLLAPSNRLEPGPPTWWDTFGLVGPGVASVGLLLAWAASLSKKRPERAKLRVYGIRMGLAGLFLLIVPVLLGGAIDAARGAEGRFLALGAAIYFGEPGIALLAAAMVLFAISGEFS